jgi:hypothetical protein
MEVAGSGMMIAGGVAVIIEAAATRLSIRFVSAHIRSVQENGALA